MHAAGEPRRKKAYRMPSKFLVVDDHPLFRDALQVAIGSVYQDAEITEASSIASAQEILAKESSFDLITLDLSLPGTQGFEGLLEIRAAKPNQPILVVSAHEDPKIIQGAMNCGATGYVSKAAKRPELAEAIKSVIAGLVTVPKDFQPPEPGGNDDDQIAARVRTLTRQQLRVLTMVRQGMLNKQIAHELGVGETTIKAHMSEIIRKLDVVSRTQAVIETSRLDFDAIVAESASEAQQKTEEDKKA